MMIPCMKKRSFLLENRDIPVVKNKEAGNKASTSKPKSTPPPKDTYKNVTKPKGKEKKKIIKEAQIKDKLVLV